MCKIVCDYICEAAVFQFLLEHTVKCNPQVRITYQRITEDHVKFSVNVIFNIYLAKMGTQTIVESEFNELQFEKQLTSLKDSQEAINSCCKWCLEHRVHHKKIVNCWLNVLKRVKVEQRLILFYLANDVVQYSKRRNYEYVASWGTAIQKATTMVRDEKVKHKILRIFKIWEQRNVYNDEFISDLCGLLNITPTGSKTDEPHEFQPNYVVNKIKSCSKLEKDTDGKLKLLKEHNPKIQFDDNLIGSLKERAHVDDVEKEVEEYIKHMEDYINALKLEIKNRIALISVLKQAETQLESDRKDVKVVANAYRMFGTRVKTFQKKLDEHKATLSSPIPSPDIDAPSPNSDSDIELPEEDHNVIVNQPKEDASAALYNPKAELQFAAGYYNSAVASSEKENNSYLTNGFSSFIGSDMQFSLDNLNSTVFGNSDAAPQSEQQSRSFTPPAAIQNPPLPVQAPVQTNLDNTSYSYSTSSYSTSHLPLQPPPMPPFSKSEVEYSNPTSFDMIFTSNTSTTPQFDESYNNTTSIYNSSIPSYTTTPTTDPSRVPQLFQEDSFEPPLGANPYPPNAEYKSEEYNPEEGTDVWDQQQDQHGWNNLTTALNSDTPESPPMFEKEGYRDPVEYHDNAIRSGVEDVDQRVLPGVSAEMDDSMGSLGVKDVDHRNLISLTGSPANSNSNNGPTDNSWIQADQDYRLPPPVTTLTGDRDYRMSFNIEQLKLPPPPPPPAKHSDSRPTEPEPSDSGEENVQEVQENSTLVALTKSPRVNDNIESIDMDMDLSDDDFEGRLNSSHENLKVIVDGSKDDSQFSLQPPPPLPELPDDVDANNLLDDLSSDLHEFSNLSDDLNNCTRTDAQVTDVSSSASGVWNQTLMPPPGVSVNMRSMMGGHPPHTHLLNAPPPLMPSMSAPPPPPIPLGNHMMSPPPIMPPPPHPTWLSKDGADMVPNNDGVTCMNDKTWFNEEIHWEADENISGDEENMNFVMLSDQDPMGMQSNWMGAPIYNNNSNFPPFRGGRANMRGPNNNFGKRGRGRGGISFNNRGGNMNFRGPRGGFFRGGNRGNWPRGPGGNFRGQFSRGGFS